MILLRIISILAVNVVLGIGLCAIIVARHYSPTVDCSPYNGAGANQRSSFSDERLYGVSLRCHLARRHNNATYQSPAINGTNAVIFTSHVTLDRLNKTARWCEVWQGPMSLSIFVRPSQSVHEVVPAFVNHPCIGYFADIHVVRRRAVFFNATAMTLKRQWMRADDRDRAAVLSRETPEKMRSELDIYGDLNDIAEMSSYYPFNVQRNAAGDGALVGTSCMHGAVSHSARCDPFLFVVDIDMELQGTTANAAEALSHHATAVLRPYLSSRRVTSSHFFVVPAVETVVKEMPVPENRADLAERIRDNSVVAFYGHYCKGCHNPTNMNRFVRASEPYAVQFIEDYEPYGFGLRSAFPRYNESFIGRGWDKMSFFYEMHRMQRLMIVVPGEFFLVHRGRGDMPERYGSVFMVRQKVNMYIMKGFKQTMDQRHGLYALDYAGPAPPAEEREMLSAIGHFPWQTVASSTGKDGACRVGNRATEGLERQAVADALSWTCAQIDCSPLGRERVRYLPGDVTSRADWAFDRYMRYAVKEQHEPLDQSCNFSSIAVYTPCEECHSCAMDPDANDADALLIIRHICGDGGHESLLGPECPIVFTNQSSPLGVTVTSLPLRLRAAFFMTFVVLSNRCNGESPAERCSFGGLGVPARCPPMQLDNSELQ